jgi:hypothetical protein
MVTNLAALANLKSLIIQFFPPPSRPDLGNRRRPPTRTVLPALTRLDLQGMNEYLDDLLARIDVSLLESISIALFHQLIFDIPQLARLLRRTTRLQALNEAHVYFYWDLDLDDFCVQVGSLPPIFDDKFKLRIVCGELDGLLSSLAQACISFFPSIYMVEHLYIYGLPEQWQNEAENMPWLEIFHPFTGMKNLYVPRILTPFIALALQGLVGERVTDVLPALENIFLEDLQPSGAVQEAIGQFVSARQLSDHPVAISHWNTRAL